MTTIYRANNARLSVADAKRLIRDAAPRGEAADIYASIDEQGNIDFNGPIEVIKNGDVNIVAWHLDDDFPEMCKAFSVIPRDKYRPVKTDYAGDASLDDFYTIAHDEFVRLAELFGLLVVIGDAPEPRASLSPRQPGFYTLGEAAQAIADGLGQGKFANAYLLQLMKAVRAQDLKPRDRFTKVPYWPVTVREDDEVVTPADVNAWAAKHDVPWRLEVPTPEQQAAPVVTPEPTASPVVAETVEQRCTRYLDLFEAEEMRGKRGALQRAADSVGADRSNFRKDVNKARDARAENRRAGGFVSQFVRDGKRQD